MRRDVNRSLLVWPAAASAAIVVGSWLHQPGRLAEFHRQTVSARAEIAGWWRDQPVRDRVTRVERPSSPKWGLLTTRPVSPTVAADRSARGSDGQQSPDRIAGIWDPSSGPLIAPRVDERQELAGLSSTLRFVLEVPEGRGVSVEDLNARREATGNAGGIAANWDNLRGGLGSFGSEGGFGPEERETPEIGGDVDHSGSPRVTLESPALPRTGTVSANQASRAGTVPADGEPGLADVVPRSARVANVASARTPSIAADAGVNAESPNGDSARLAVNGDSARSVVSRESSRRVGEIADSARNGVGDAADGDSARNGDGDAAGDSARNGEADGHEDREGYGDRAAEAAGEEKGRGGWPVAERLEQQLRTLTAVASGRRATGTQLVSAARPAVTTGADAVRWSADVQGLLTQLRSLEQLADPEAGELIGALSEQAGVGLRLAEDLEDRREQLEWLRAGHALSRRLAVWDAIWRLARGSSDSNTEHSTTTRQVAAAIEGVRRELAVTGDAAGWESYLLLADLERLASAGGGHERASAEVEAERALLAQRLLSRLRWHGLDRVHRDWLDREPIAALAESVRGWNRTSVDYPKLLDQLESKESDSIDLASLEIADAVQSLRFASRPGAPQVAKVVDAHYRNANVRVAISNEFLERLLPEVEPQTVPVRAMLFGSRVRGVSQVSTDLRLQLLPSGDRWSLRLLSEGAVETRSVGRNGPVAVRTSGTSNFVASKPIVVTRDGVRLGEADANVDGGSRLRGIETEYDGWPLIGSLVRGIATSRYLDLKPRTDRYAEEQVRREVAGEIDGRVEESVGEATERLNRSLFGPLGTLQLDPMVVDLQTTGKRLISRYRLAGDWQLAAYTPRPRAPRSSLMSLQIHQSAINNTVEQLVPREESRSIDAIVREILSRFERPGTRLPDDIPADVMIQFAPTRPVTVEIEEGRLWVTMRVIRLSQGDHLDLRRFIVRAGYRPEVEGREARLVRDGHLSISGPAMSMRERLPVRAIFNKVFSTSRPLPLMLPVITEHPAMDDLVVSQLELRDGWVGFALSHRDAPRITPRLATRPDE